MCFPARPRHFNFDMFHDNKPLICTHCGLYEYFTLYKWMDDKKIGQKETIESDKGIIIFLIITTFYTREALIYLK